MIEAVLFDLYDTLAYIDIRDYLQTKTQMAAEAGVSANALIAQWKQYTHPANRGEVLTVEERVARVLRDLSVEPTKLLIRQLSELEIELQEQRIRLFKDTYKVLELLKGKGLKLGLVTNASLATREVPEILSINCFFDAIVFSYTIGVCKPEPEIYLAACERLMVSPSACLFVGDGNDCELDGAHRLGMQTVMITTNRHELIRTEQSSSFDYRVQNLSKLIPIVANLFDRA
jgi:putative hydrolase of the HAD superfamily